MKTITTLALAASAALTLGAGAAVAQNSTAQPPARFSGQTQVTTQTAPGGYATTPSGTYAVQTGHYYLDPGMVSGGSDGSAAQ